MLRPSKESSGSADLRSLEQHGVRRYGWEEESYDSAWAEDEAGESSYADDGCGKAVSRNASRLTRSGSAPNIGSSAKCKSLDASIVQMENQRLREEIRGMCSTIKQQSSPLSQLWAETNVLQQHSPVLDVTNGARSTGAVTNGLSSMSKSSSSGSLMRGVAHLGHRRRSDAHSGMPASHVSSTLGSPTSSCSSTLGFPVSTHAAHRSQNATVDMVTPNKTARQAGCTSVVPSPSCGLAATLCRYPSDARLPLFSPTIGPRPQCRRLNGQRTVASGQAINEQLAGGTHSSNDVVITALSAEAPAGTRRLQVVNTEGFAVGDVIRIGKEFNVISGFGSILLQHPLESAHPSGTPISKVQHAVAHGTTSASDSKPWPEAPGTPAVVDTQAAFAECGSPIAHHSPPCAAPSASHLPAPLVWADVSAASVAAVTLSSMAADGCSLAAAPDVACSVHRETVGQSIVLSHQRHFEAEVPRLLPPPRAVNVKSNVASVAQSHPEERLLERTLSHEHSAIPLPTALMRSSAKLRSADSPAMTQSPQKQHAAVTGASPHSGCRGNDNVKRQGRGTPSHTIFSSHISPQSAGRAARASPVVRSAGSRERPRVTSPGSDSALPPALGEERLMLLYHGMREAESTAHDLPSGLHFCSTSHSLAAFGPPSQGSSRQGSATPPRSPPGVPSSRSGTPPQTYRGSSHHDGSPQLNSRPSSAQPGRRRPVSEIVSQPSLGHVMPPKRKPLALSNSTVSKTPAVTSPKLRRTVGPQGSGGMMPIAAQVAHMARQTTSHSDEELSFGETTPRSQRSSVAHRNSVQNRSSKEASGHPRTSSHGEQSTANSRWHHSDTRWQRHGANTAVDEHESSRRVFGSLAKHNSMFTSDEKKPTNSEDVPRAGIGSPSPLRKAEDHVDGRRATSSPSVGGAAFFEVVSAVAKTMPAASDHSPAASRSAQPAVAKASSAALSTAPNGPAQPEVIKASPGGLSSSDSSESPPSSPERATVKRMSTKDYATATPKRMDSKDSSSSASPPNRRGSKDSSSSASPPNQKATPVLKALPAPPPAARAQADSDNDSSSDSSPDEAPTAKAVAIIPSGKGNGKSTIPPSTAKSVTEAKQNVESPSSSPGNSSPGVALAISETAEKKAEIASAATARTAAVAVPAQAAPRPDSDGESVEYEEEESEYEEEEEEEFEDEEEEEEYEEEAEEETSVVSSQPAAKAKAVATSASMVTAQGSKAATVSAKESVTAK